jgi:DNA-binding CsgD family transcriptional regulator
VTNFDSVALDQQWLRLTRREREILLWVGGGMSNKEIAQRLGLSVGTVKIHLHSIFRKTGGKKALRACCANGHA